MELSTTPVAIPVIDVSALSGGSEAAEGAGKELVEACTRIGSFYIIGHGIPEPVINAAFEASRGFFALADDEKLRIHARNCPPHRGYVRVKERKLGSAVLLDQASVAGDLKENLDFGPALAADDPAVRPGSPFYGPNVWPARPAELRPAVETYYGALKSLAGRLLQGIALGLGLDRDYFAQSFDRPLTRLKMIHYPPPPDGAEIPEGVGSHSDFSCLTILAQDGIEGLEIFDKSGRPIKVRPLPGALFINVGDQFARWSNDRFWPTLHRVLNVTRRDRYSIAFFLHPNFDATISALEPCIPAGGSPLYPPILAGEDLLARLQGAYDRQ